MFIVYVFLFHQRHLVKMYGHKVPEYTFFVSVKRSATEVRVYGYGRWRTVREGSSTMFSLWSGRYRFDQRSNKKATLIHGHIILLPRQFWVYVCDLVNSSPSVVDQPMSSVL